MVAKDPLNQKGTPSLNSDIKCLFGDICKPYVMKTAWEPLSKAKCNIYSQGEKYWISLTSEKSGLNILNTPICPLTSFENRTSNQVLLGIFRDGIQTIYMIKFRTNDIVEDFTSICGISKKRIVRNIQQKLLDRLIILPPDQWDNDSSDTQFNDNSIDITKLTKNNICSIMGPEDEWINIGHVNTKLEISGPNGNFISTRLVITSNLTNRFEFLSIELEKECFSFKNEGSFLFLRLSYGDKICDFRFTENGLNLEQKLLEEFDKADERYTKGAALLMEASKVNSIVN